MTTFERFERDIPELMTELAPARVPDYFDDMLRQTATQRQRPAWSYPERWLPMGVIARTVPMRTISWRPIAVLALLILLVAAALAAYVGSQPRLPAPFGLARNGQIVFSDALGKIQQADPSTGTLTPVVVGPQPGLDPAFANDGTHFAFARGTPDARALFVANADGSGVHQVIGPGPEIAWFRWSPSGDRIALSRNGDDFDSITVAQVADGTTRTLHLGVAVQAAMWRPSHDQLLVTAGTTTTGGVAETGFYVVGADGTGLRPIVVSPAVINTPTVSPDGATLAYTTWESGAEGRVHLVDVETGTIANVDFSPSYPFTDLSPRFSPDGTKLLVERYEGTSYRLTILPVDGRGPVVTLGEPHPEGTNGAMTTFSPDGTKVLATYQDDGKTWQFDLVTGQGERLAWLIPTGYVASWQRLAP
jgi:Tol biopolymer transport system component